MFGTRTSSRAAQVLETVPRWGWSARRRDRRPGPQPAGVRMAGVAGLRNATRRWVSRGKGAGVLSDQLVTGATMAFRELLSPTSCRSPRAGSRRMDRPRARPALAGRGSSTGPSCRYRQERGEPGGSPKKVRGGDLLPGPCPTSSALRQEAETVAVAANGRSRSNRQPGAIFGGWRPGAAHVRPGPVPTPGGERPAPGPSESSRRHSTATLRGSGSAVKDC